MLLIEFGAEMKVICVSRVVGFCIEKKRWTIQPFFLFKTETISNGI